MERETPIWMVLLLILFGISTAASFGSFLFFHAKTQSYVEEFNNQKQIKGGLTTRLEFIESGTRDLAQPILDRREELTRVQLKIDEAKNDIDNKFIVEQQVQVAETSEAIKEQLQRLSEALDKTKKNRLALAKEEETTVENEKRADEDRRDLRLEVEKLSRELEMEKRKYRDELQGYQVQITSLTDRVHELKDRVDITRTDLVSDGQLLEARADHGFVFIDRGINHNLRKGTLFTVYNRRGGHNVHKGRIEVMKVHPQMAECRVLEEVDANDPLIPGDHIHNAIYNPDEVKIFVIKGNFKTYSRAELKRFIENVGGKVEDDLTIRSHYLVAGGDADAAITEASTYGVIILSEDKLMEFVHSPVRFQVRKNMKFTIAGTFHNDISVATIREIIVNNGGIIADEIDQSVDVLIAGENCMAEIIQARASGITVLTQDQLLHLRRSEDLE